VGEEIDKEGKSLELKTDSYTMSRRAVGEEKSDRSLGLGGTSGL